MYSRMYGSSEAPNDRVARAYRAGAGPPPARNGRTSVLLGCRRSMERLYLCQVSIHALTIFKFKGLVITACCPSYSGTYVSSSPKRLDWATLGPTFHHLGLSSIPWTCIGNRGHQPSPGSSIPPKCSHGARPQGVVWPGRPHRLPVVAGELAQSASRPR